MRRPMHEGQKPRPLHDNGTRELVAAPHATEAQEPMLEVAAAQQARKLGGDEPRQCDTVVLDALDEGR
jgi:hypothetical protein